MRLQSDAGNLVEILPRHLDGSRRTRSASKPLSREQTMMRVHPRSAVAVLLLGAALAGCTRPSPPTSQTPAKPAASTNNTLTPEEQAEGWRLLFDGETTDGWRGYRREDMPAGWQVVDGALTRVADAGDIVTRDTFRDFDLRLEWNVAPGGNSGVMYRVTEDERAPYMTGPEMQVLDDARHDDGASRLTSAGAAYALYPSPAGVVKPAGEWNAVRIMIDDGHVEHWLNGQHVVAFELGSPDWERRVKESKFVKWPGFGRAPEGHLALQDHGDRVAYRNIKIKALVENR